MYKFIKNIEDLKFISKIQNLFEIHQNYGKSGNPKAILKMCSKFIKKLGKLKKWNLKAEQ